MKAILLAAGIGKRLHPFTKHSPKCLLEIGGISLLQYSLSALQTAGISEVVIVVGHRKERIYQCLAGRRGGPSIQFVENPDYHLGSVLSLWTAHPYFSEDLLIMDADVLFPGFFLSRLMHSPHANAMLLDESSKSLGEEQMVLVRDGRVVNSTKHPSPPYDLIGEGIGFFKLSHEATPIFKKVLEQFVQTFPEIEYEETFATLFQSVMVGYETVGGFPWIEIDFPEDISRAEQAILPQIKTLEAEISKTS